ncbi:hypothetical protein TELCIR_17578 [Teladorsagia circumcincta]|uniref:Glutathione peroxidase n=1 Tax=Teladorsagia circumcincta TaxID=45464 RepID=A0A2G9TSE0_TELCI|nr:hypothetical protein TELCIR_17578 [Teladorsagia circumcincta]
MFDAIKWNFTKFLVDREGNVVKRLYFDAFKFQVRAYNRAKRYGKGHRKTSRNRFCINVKLGIDAMRFPLIHFDR